MALALDARDFDQGGLIDQRRPAQQRTRDQDFVLARELADQRAWRVAEHGQPFGQIGARGGFGVRHEIDQNAVEQIDMVGPQVRSPLQEQLGDPASGLGKAPGIALLEDLIEPGDQRGSSRHEHYSNPAERRALQTI